MIRVFRTVEEEYRYFKEKEDREWFFNQFKEELKKHNLPFVELNAFEAEEYFFSNMKKIYKG